VIPGSRSQTYQDQCQLVESHKRRTGAPYALPHALEAAVSILMHYAKTGEALYTDNQLGEKYTFTRCQEKVDNNKWPVAIGGVAAGGLRVDIYNPYGIGLVGVAGAQKLGHRP